MELRAVLEVGWSDPACPIGITLDRVYFGPDPHGLGGIQVAVGTAESTPSRQVLRDLFTSRRGKAAIQLVVAIVHDATAHIFGPDPHAQPLELPVSLARRQLQSILSEPDVLAATERLAGFRKANDSTGAAGFTNSGLFATHHLTANVPRRTDWEELGRQAEPLLSLRSRQLVEALGFVVQPGVNGTYTLSVNGQPPRAVAILLDDSEHFDAKATRFQLSPVAFGLAVASRAALPWLVVLRKDQIRLYPGQDGVGVGSKGQSDTYLEVDLATIDAEFAALLPLVFSADALAAGGSADELLRDSARFASDLGARLRERIYDEIVPPMAVEVAQRLERDAGVSLDSEGLQTAYRVTLRILFRLLFQAYAEDRGLLPSGRNEGFDANSLKTNARRLTGQEAGDFGDSSTIWFDLVQVWSAIDQGNPQWQIPAYNGGLFSADPDRSPEGALIKRIEIPDTVLGPALKSLLIDVSPDGVPGPVDFRSLSVREFGTIYEGLLESSLSMASQDLTIDTKGAWTPASEGDEIQAAAGSVYFHTASGERKATGSYFTPKVVVDHLIERSIVPALSDHLEKISGYLDNRDEVSAGREFFDFRVADLAMGSGHFLVAAVDKIEALMRSFLTDHSVPAVTDELMRLAGVATQALGTDDVAKSEVDEVGLLRRQIARRCIYGLDVNPMAVELARLALWIHTFVPGLPMSNLDHGLVCANSLTGIGTIDEAIDALVGTSESFQVAQASMESLSDGLFEPEGSLFSDAGAPASRESGYQVWLRGVVTDFLDEARPLLGDMANASEATKAEVDQASHLLEQARLAAEPARRIFDAAVAVRLGAWSTQITRPEHLAHLTDSTGPGDIVRHLRPAHMPYLFPEVFSRPEPGFDVLIGNPPWEKVRHEPQQFWVIRDPGLHSLRGPERSERIDELRKMRPVDREQEEHAIQVSESHTRLFSRAYRLQSSQHYDYAKLFAERYLSLSRRRGAVGLVMPQALLVLGGWKPIREEMVTRHHLSVTPLRNSGQWAFENVHPQTTMCVLVVSPGSGATVRAAAVSEAQFTRLDETVPLEMELNDIQDLSEDLNIPWFEGSRDPLIFDVMAKNHRLGSHSGWITGRADSTRWDFSSTGRNARHAAVTGTTGNEWRVTMTRHVTPFVIKPTAEGKWVKDIDALAGGTSGLLRSGSRIVVGPQHPAIVYRFPTNNDNSRTLIAAALPAEGWLFSKGYAHGVLLPEDAPKRDVLALLGYLNSVPADWWARRFVDRHLGKRIIEGMPLPPWSVGQRERVAGLVEGILVDGGVTEIAGPRQLNASRAIADVDGAMARINAEAFVALGLTSEDAESMFEDFAVSEASLPASQRAAILEAMRQIGQVS